MNPSSITLNKAGIPAMPLQLQRWTPSLIVHVIKQNIQRVRPRQNPLTVVSGPVSPDSPSLFSETGSRFLLLVIIFMFFFLVSLNLHIIVTTVSNQYFFFTIWQSSRITKFSCNYILHWRFLVWVLWSLWFQIGSTTYHLCSFSKDRAKTNYISSEALVCNIILYSFTYFTILLINLDHASIDESQVRDTYQANPWI
ncbi:Hypothetical_protein [Hexamita inflata]|uniref:Hypothetical_protein n=1 Tax=Hexamita inflata TaxID=28002 RepID=A0AA86RI80_9EUKA|nr:Hypothetical protein HINF_LOCUS62908 [Hexamita inflata]